MYAPTTQGLLDKIIRFFTKEGTKDTKSPTPAPVPAKLDNTPAEVSSSVLDDFKKLKPSEQVRFVEAQRAVFASPKSSDYERAQASYLLKELKKSGLIENLEYSP